jgi:hypothetical protein
MAAETEISLSDIAAFLPGEIQVEEKQETDKEELAGQESSETVEESKTLEDQQDPAKSEESEGSEDEDKESDQEDEEKPEETEGEKPKATEKLLKRIDKLTAKRRTAEESLAVALSETERLKGALAESSKVVLAPTPEDPLTDVESLEDLEARIATAKRIRTWAMTNRDGATVKGANGQEEFVDAAEMARHLASADAIVTEHGPARKEWIAQREVSVSEARASYPGFFTQGSTEQKAYRDIIKAYPFIARYPNAELIIGDAIVGQQVRQAKLQAQSKAQANSQAPAPGSGVSRRAPSAAPEPPRVSGKSKVPASSKAAEASLQKVFDGNSDRESVASLMEQLLG